MGQRVQRVLMQNLGSETLRLGYEGENEHTLIVFSCLDIFNDYPDAEVTLTVQAPNGEIYHAGIERDGIQIIWEVTDDDVRIPGAGRVQRTITDGEEIIRSDIGGTQIEESLKTQQGG